MGQVRVAGGWVLCVTPNPALDVFTEVAEVVPVHKLRCQGEHLHPGGGGVNVARVLHRLGTPVRALHPAGGLRGRRLAALLRAEGVPARAVPMAGETRENVTIHEQCTGRDWRFVMPGPRLSAAEWQACVDALGSWRRAPAWVVLSGSLPPGVSAAGVRRLLARARSLGCSVAVDSSGLALEVALRAGVDLVKPSLRELREHSGLALPDTASQLAACRALVASGAARRVALSLGEEGALLVDPQGAWSAAALKVPVHSTIGAGDSFLGGLLHGLWADPQADGADLLRLAMGAGAAALSSPGTALAQAGAVRRLARQVVCRGL